MQPKNHLESHIGSKTNAPMADFDSEAENYVRRVMRELDISASDLADLIDVAQTTITRPLNQKESGYRITERTIRLIESTTGIPFSGARLAKSGGPVVQEYAIRPGSVTVSQLTAALGPILEHYGVERGTWPVVAESLLKALEVGQSLDPDEVQDRDYEVAGRFAARELHQKIQKSK